MDMHFIIVALIFNVLDFISGLLYAIKNKDLKSSVMRDGLFKKAGYVLCYVLGVIIDTGGSYVGLDIPAVVTKGICAYVSMTEVVSILENIYRINDKIVPEKIMELLHITTKE